MTALERLLGKIKLLPMTKLTQTLVWILLVVIAYLCAQLSWKLYPSQQQVSSWTPQAVGGNQAQVSHDVSELIQLNLFGRASAVAKPKPVETAKVIDAPKTNLSIQLTGVVASSELQNGLAVIDSKGSQDTYSIGDKIVGTSASLKEVYADRIIITNGGRYETLMLDGLSYTPASNDSIPRAKVQQQDNSDNAELMAELQATREDVLADPSKITDFIAISPVQVSGELQGYRLNPGKDRQLFADAGFEGNDLAKTINGYDLTDMAQSIELMAQLPELTDVSVMVERQGQLIEISFSLPQ
ncbi:type II secretion system protein GspC [Shewanella sp. NIFS-20-20]|uniref:type II secretion system protein GspC n=1 Tax=Shewanella sp. NIFS-20-20 TaxID=2853806 RepID=UPI001C4594AE|nr:type II secretion system protein GspC [Shewanella sp. NIFS-20-20]MBV7316691.1 type II secretion system protein GspC [Shewanella sp. NIFS-20-20]